MPGPWSRTVSSPSRSVTSTVRRRAVLGRVVEQVGDRAVEPAAHAVDDRRLQVGRRTARPGACRAARSTAAATSSSSRSASRLGDRLLLAREVDEVGDEQRQLLELGDHVRAQRARGRPAASPPRPEHLEVGAQRRQRRAQLVRRVGDELALRALGAVQRLEHRVERAREPRQLVVARRARSGASGRACGRRARRRRSARPPGLTAVRVASRASASAAATPSSTIAPSPSRSVAERGVDLVERPRDLQRAAVRRCASCRRAGGARRARRRRRTASRSPVATACSSLAGSSSSGRSPGGTSTRPPGATSCDEQHRPVERRGGLGARSSRSSARRRAPAPTARIGQRLARRAARRRSGRAARRARTSTSAPAASTTASATAAAQRERQAAAEAHGARRT